MIVPNLQLNAGNNTDPSIIFRPWEDRNQSMENQFGAGRVEPEKEKNPQAKKDSHQVEPEKEKNPKQENEELLEQSHENDSHQVEPEKEKNPEPEAAKQQDLVIRKDEKTISFRNRLFKISYEPENKKDISKTGKHYKPKLGEKLKNI